MLGTANLSLSFLSMQIRRCIPTNQSIYAKRVRIKICFEIIFQALVIVNNVPFGGTILNANHVITSCGAVLNAQNELVAASAITIRVGSVLYTGGVSNTVTAVFPHPE